MGFDYKEKLAKHGSQQGTVASQPQPALAAPPLSTDLRLGPWSPLSPQGWALPHCSAEQAPCALSSPLTFFSPVTSGVCAW